MTDLTPDDGERLRIQAQLADELARTRTLQGPDSRSLFLQQLRQRHGFALLADHGDPLRQGHEVAVHGCRVVDGVHVIVAVVEALEGASDQVLKLHQLREEWEAAGEFQPLEWELRRDLLAVCPPHLTRLYQRATGQSAPPRWCDNAWRMFVHLAGMNTPVGLPPSVVLLVLLEPEVDPHLVEKIRRRNRSWAAALDRRLTDPLAEPTGPDRPLAAERLLSAELDRRRYLLLDAKVDEPGTATVYLVIQIEPDLTPTETPAAGSGMPATASERFRLSLFRQWRDADAWRTEPVGGPQTVPRHQLETTVEKAVSDAEAAWAGVRDMVVVEFVLPTDLLNTDVAWWQVDDPPMELAMAYPVVVRSLERQQTRHWHGRWGRRWRQLQEQPTASEVYWSDPVDLDTLTRLQTDLNVDESCVALVLSEPPEPHRPSGTLEVTAALQAGLPVIIWHRVDCRDGEFRAAVDRLTAGAGLAQLPMRLRELRVRALRLAADRRAGDVGRHVTILWDDWDRRLVAAGGVGGEAEEG